jgi:Predicted AAA-ATPase
MTSQELLMIQNALKEANTTPQSFRKNPISFKVGSSKFEDILKSDGIFIDKTLFIRDFIEANFLITCLLRPRRFGKTTILNMLESFFKLGTDPKSFDRYAISKEKDIMKRYCGKFPVVYLSLVIA